MTDQGSTPEFACHRPSLPESICTAVAFDLTPLKFRNNLAEPPDAANSWQASP
jgi:hypothetical protein